MAKKETRNFENSIKHLEKLVSKMESGDASLEESLILFEEGMDLIKICQEQLKDAEKKVQALIKKTDDGFHIEEIK